MIYIILSRCYGAYMIISKLLFGNFFVGISR
jgi:hypothetical protein